MVSIKHDRTLVVIELEGGNDALNTIIPYTDGLYYDSRPGIGIPQSEVLKINGELGFNPSMSQLKHIWHEGGLAIVNGIGYPKPDRSHFRSRDIWYTAEPEKIGATGWLGAAIRDLDATGDNVLTGINFGRGLPRALVCKGVPVASVGNLDTYGLLPDIANERARINALESFSLMYGPAAGKDVIADALSRAGSDALVGAAALRTAPEQYSSTIEYADNPLSKNLKSAAQVMSANLGTRIFYTRYGSFDTHSNELQTHAKLWKDVSSAVGDFVDDLKEHEMYDDTIIFIYSEFGRRIKDNGTGCDHGSGGVALILGGQVNGGCYGELPSLVAAHQSEGDLSFNNDFRCSYATLLERWLELDPDPIVNGHFEQFEFITK